MSVKISIILAAYNGERFLEAQVRSILSQTHRELELIIADDCSTDRSVEIAERMAANDSRVRVFKNGSNKGLAKNFLSALRIAEGPLICFSDQDDIWRNDKVEVLSSLLLRNPRNMLAYSDMEICDEGLRTTFPSFWKAAGVRPYGGMLRELPLLRNIAPGCSMMFRREVRDSLLRVPPDCSFMHDHLTFVFAAALGNIVYTREKLVKYRQHQQNNIGAFYPSVSDRNRFREQLGREIRILRLMLPLDLRGLELFLDEKTHKNILSRLSFIHYYLFLRSDTFADKLLGIFECLFPGLYSRLRQRLRRERDSLNRQN